MWLTENFKYIRHLLPYVVVLVDDSPITISLVGLFLLPVTHLKMGTGWPNQAHNDEQKMAGVIPNSDAFVQDPRSGLFQMWLYHV